MKPKPDSVESLGLKREYRSWLSMLQRCYLPSAANYRNYGARGIGVCEKWRVSFYAFLADMGLRPEGTTLDRRDNDGDYALENCRWATDIEQHRNRRDNVVLEFRGERRTVSEWAGITGINEVTIGGRLRRGWSIEQALTQSPSESARIRGRKRQDARTVCRRGHKLTAGNFRITNRNYKACLICERQNLAMFHAARKAH